MQDIFLEEERHQQAMMALESSVLGCGSDDWSVDSDYAFQDFADDVKHHQLQHHERGEQLPQSCAQTPERSTLTPGTPSSARKDPNPTNDLNTASRHHLHDNPDAEAEAAGATASPAGSGEAIRGEALMPRNGGDIGEESAVGSGRDDPRDPSISKARLFGDPGSSTDSAHILRLEQRMFLKVGIFGMGMLPQGVYKMS